MHINGGRQNDWRASVKPPTVPNTSPKYGANIATNAVVITSNARIMFCVTIIEEFDCRCNILFDIRCVFIKNLINDVVMNTKGK
jgi:hypothetical protein